MTIKKQQSSQSAQMRWAFDPATPTHDFLEDLDFEHDEGDLQEAVENFVYWLEEDRFLTWEAVACQEQGITLTRSQEQALGGLLNFDDAEEGPIHYIDGIDRPSEAWHVILNRIVPHLLIQPYRTFDCQFEVRCDGWDRIVAALREHAQGLSLPEGIDVAEKVVAAELRHKLELQSCFDILGGFGQCSSLTLENPEEHERVDRFIDGLRERKESAAHFGLTLESLATMLVMPDKDWSVFDQLMRTNLGLQSAREPIADRL